jgi:hypothetical protein
VHKTNSGTHKAVGDLELPYWAFVGQAWLTHAAGHEQMRFSPLCQKKSPDVASMVYMYYHLHVLLHILLKVLAVSEKTVYKMLMNKYKIYMIIMLVQYNYPL